VGFVKIGEGGGGTFLMTLNKIKIKRYRKTGTDIESKEGFGKLCELRHWYTTHYLVLYQHVQKV
jgi:hypothetical protein